MTTNGMSPALTRFGSLIAMPTVAAKATTSATVPLGVS
jgi:hypothetical protein